MLHVCAVAGFFNRYKCATRIIRMFLMQDYEGPSTLLLYNNGPQIYSLAPIELPDNKKIILVNNNVELSTGLPYKDTGTIFNDALTFIPEGVDVVTFNDTDDFYLPNHLSAGISGYLEATNMGHLAYKPFKSWFKYVDEPPRLEHNTMEPSFFIDKNFLINTGMHPVTASYHMKWIDLLKQEGKLFTKVGAPATFLYWWGGDDGVYKTSSGGDSPEAFKRLRDWEKDEGSQVLFPCSVEEIEHYYKIIR